MASPPRTREFYRPLVEDLHEAALEWRGSLSRLHVRESLILVGVVLAGTALFVGLAGYFASLTPGPEINPAPLLNVGSHVGAFEERGARFGRNLEGSITQATLQGVQFTDSDMQALSTIHTLESITLIDAKVTDEGLMSLRLQRLEHLELINTEVTDEAAEAYPGMAGPPDVRVRVIREAGAD